MASKADSKASRNKGFQNIFRRRAREKVRLASLQARLTTWAHYSFLVGRFNDAKKALNRALKRTFPDHPNREIDRKREFELWTKHDLWPPPELEGTPYGKSTRSQIDSPERERSRLSETRTSSPCH